MAICKEESQVSTFFVLFITFVFVVRIRLILNLSYSIVSVGNMCSIYSFPIYLHVTTKCGTFTRCMYGCMGLCN